MTACILAIETASERCSVALEYNGTVFCDESEQPRGHADLILKMVQNVLDEAEISMQALDALAYSKGPGAFTSIRIGISAVQGLALGSGLQVAGASSLEIMAQKFASDEGRVVLAALDARMHEVYFGVYQINNGKAEPLQAEQVAKPVDITLEEIDISGAICTGSGWQAYAEEMQERFSAFDLEQNPEKYPHARQLLDIAQQHFVNGQLLSADQVLPVYIRDKVTHGG